MRKPSQKAVVHIGFHKTGTTSIQYFLHQHHAKLANLGIAMFTGAHIPSNHVELMVATLRTDRSAPFKLDSNLDGGPEYYSKVASAIAAFKASTDAETLLFSAEGLSYLRYQDELTRLHQLLDTDQVCIVAYLRDQSSWLESYAAELKRHTLPTVVDSHSFAYLGQDSWLLDFHSRLQPFYRQFGPTNVRVLHYDAVCAHDQNVIPSFLRLLNVNSHFSPDDYSAYKLNSRA